MFTTDCPHQEVTTVPSSIKNNLKTTEFRHVLSSTSQQWPWLHALWCIQGNLPVDVTWWTLSLHETTILEIESVDTFSLIFLKDKD